ncbi:hypothetical protein L6452_23568 [Arctium lappa]|uniref:Uncharacterized protein n=1 Tax=Arctium lappa TaxID=4217 RepID=A0ACB9B2B1_ARCLA|nr:hypothetical protein L6452_23568 [Arctium lappa]
MSAVRFDIRNEGCAVAVAKHTGIVCMNVDRFSFAITYPKNYIPHIMWWIGRPFSDLDLQHDLKEFPFSVTEGPDGFPLIHTHSHWETQSFTPIQAMGMVFSKAKKLAENDLKAAVVDCCIGIPVYFTDLQRRVVMDAAAIAGLNPLRLMHETTATALAYGLYKTDLCGNKQLNVAFVDIGRYSMQAYYKIDVFENASACIMLRAACEKLKEVLRSNPEAPLYVECLIDKKHVRGFIKRDEFKQISASILERMMKPLEKALLEAKLTLVEYDNLLIEVVGSDSWVIKILTELFGKEPRCTMNSSECVSRGCALQCAILSPNFKVREFQVEEIFPFPIALQCKDFTSMIQDYHYRGTDDLQSCIVFPRGTPIPNEKTQTFYKSGTFSLDVQYADASELQAPAKISTFRILGETGIDVSMPLMVKPLKGTRKKGTEKGLTDVEVYERLTLPKT